MSIKNDFVSLLAAQIALNSISVNYTGFFTRGWDFPAGVDSINIIEAMFDSCNAENSAGGGAICCAVKGPLSFTVSSSYFFKCKTSTIDSRGGAIYYFNASDYVCKKTCFYGCSASIGHFQYVDSPSNCNLLIEQISSINSDSLIYGSGSESTKITGGRINLNDGNFSDNSVSTNANGAGLSIGSETLVNLARLMFNKNNGYSTLYLEKSPIKYNLQFFNFIDNTAISDIYVLGTYQIYQTYAKTNWTKFIAECQDGSLLLYGISSNLLSTSGKVIINKDSIKSGPFLVKAFATGECIENKQGADHKFHVPSPTPLTDNFIFSAGNAFVIISLIVVFIAISVFIVYAIIICCFKRPHIFSSIKYIEENHVPLLADEDHHEAESVYGNVVEGEAEPEVIADPEKENDDKETDTLASTALSSRSSRRSDTSDADYGDNEGHAVTSEAAPVESESRPQPTAMIDALLLEDSEAEQESSSVSKKDDAQPVDFTSSEVTESSSSPISSEVEDSDD